MEYLRDYDERLSFAEQEDLVEELISDWKFFVLSSELTSAVLSLNNELGESYFKSEYEKLAAPDGEDPLEQLLHEENWSTTREKLSTTLLHNVHDEGDRPTTLSDEEVLSFFQALVSERIFNHLAMLSRTNHARKGRFFSIREELTNEIAEKIGLGLGLHHRTTPELRAKTQKVLLALAFEFQNWLIQEHRGIFYTTWGTVYSEKRKPSLEGDVENRLILQPDV